MFLSRPLMRIRCFGPNAASCLRPFGRPRPKTPEPVPVPAGDVHQRRRRR